MPPILSIVIVLAFGLGLTAIGVEMELRGRASSSWPTATAEVVQTGIERTKSSMGSHLTQQTRYTATVRFRFPFEGQVYESTSYDVSGARHFDTEAAARAFVEQHPPGATLTVHVDPDAPGRAVVTTGLGQAGRLLLYAGGFVTLFGIAMVVKRLRRRRHSGRSTP